MDLVSRAERVLLEGEVRAAAATVTDGVTVHINGHRGGGGAGAGGRRTEPVDQQGRGVRAHPGQRAQPLVPFDIPVLPRTRLAADTRQVFNGDARAVTALRVQAYPDGGIARGRALGTPTQLGLQRLRTRWEKSS